MSIWNEVDLNYQPESLNITKPGTNDTVLDIAHYRYGLIVGSIYSSANDSLPNWDVAKRALGGCEAQIPIHSHAKRAICELVASLIDIAKGNVGYSPKTLSDLNKDGEEYLLNKNNFSISPRVENTNIGRVCWIESRNLHPSRNASWRLLIQDPATVIECLRRRWGPHLVDIAFELYSRGIAFKTCLVINYRITHDRPAVIGLGYRLSGDVPSTRDYATYENIRNKFLSTPRARAALLKGGIIWRLARDVIPEAAVLSGPSAEVYKTGQQIECESGILLDDELSEDELNLVSGVYKVFTGNVSFCWPLF
jgi:hypothetical protein